MNCFSARRSFKDRQDKHTLVHGPFIALRRLQNGVVQPVGRTNLKRRKDIILIKQKNLKRVIADRTRESFESWLAALARAKKLRLRGYEVKLPPPHLGRPQFLVIITPQRKAWERNNALPSGRQSQRVTTAVTILCFIDRIIVDPLRRLPERSSELRPLSRD